MARHGEKQVEVSQGPEQKGLPQRDTYGALMPSDTPSLRGPAGEQECWLSCLPGLHFCRAGAGRSMGPRTMAVMWLEGTCEWEC